MSSDARDPFVAVLPAHSLNRAAGLEELAETEAVELRSLSAEASICILEDLLAAGFDMIDEMIDRERRDGRDPTALARYLLEDAPR